MPFAVVALVFSSGFAGIALHDQSTSALSNTTDGLTTPQGARNQDAEAGVAVYSAACASCHQPGGIGLDGTFPPLAGNPNVADAAYVETVVREGRSGAIDVNGVTYDLVMPPVAGLSDDEIADVAAYVASLAEGGGSAETPAVPAEVAESGSIPDGKALFSGTDRLQNGGGSCSGCHVAGSVGNLGGQGLGPDLTNVSDRLGGVAGLSAWLTNPPSRTMAPIFGEKPLTEAEIADLAAFLVDAPSQDTPLDSFDWLSLTGALGLLVLLGAMAVAYRGMRQTYAEKLKSKGEARPNSRGLRGRS